MSYSGSDISRNEISKISYTSGPAGEGVTPRRLSSFRIDYEEDSASWKNSSERVEADNFE